MRLPHQWPTMPDQLRRSLPLDQAAELDHSDATFNLGFLTSVQEILKVQRVGISAQKTHNQKESLGLSLYSPPVRYFNLRISQPITVCMNEQKSLRLKTMARPCVCKVLDKIVSFPISIFYY